MASFYTMSLKTEEMQSMKIYLCLYLLAAEAGQITVPGKGPRGGDERPATSSLPESADLP